MSDPLVVARYWCHECSRVVSPVMEAEIKCPTCDGGFVEEMEMRADDPTEMVLGNAPSLWTPILLTMMHMSAARHRSGHHPEAEEEAASHRRRRRNAISMLELLHGLRAMAAEEEMGAREADREVMVLNPFLSSLAPVGASIGDYYVGPGFEQLLQQLAENDPNRQGTPPARKEAVEALRTIRVGERSSCPVCLDELEEGGEAKEMPCKHVFHTGCLLPWLELHSSCPVCRFQLPAEDESREVRQAEAEPERRSRSWPWPFSTLFSSEGGERDTPGGSSGDGRASF